MTLIQELQNRYNAHNPEKMIVNFRIRLFLDKAKEWADRVMESKNLKGDDALMFVELNQGASALVDLAREEREKAEVYASLCYDYANKLEKQIEENKELKEKIAKMEKHINLNF